MVLVAPVKFEQTKSFLVNQYRMLAKALKGSLKTLGPSLPQPKLLIGGWSGTFIDPYSKAIVGAFDQLFQKHGMQIPLPLIRSGMGRSTWDHIKVLLSEPIIRQQWKREHGRWPIDRDQTILYSQYIPIQTAFLSKDDNVRPIPKTVETLKALKDKYGLKIAVTTSFDPTISDRIIKTLREHHSPLLSLIDDVIPARGRPYPDAIVALQDKYRVISPSRIWKLDNTSPGIAEGQNANCITVGLSEYCNEMGKVVDLNPAIIEKGRQASLESLSKADYVIPTIDHLPGLMEKLAWQDAGTN